MFRWFALVSLVMLWSASIGLAQDRVLQMLPNNQPELTIDVTHATDMILANAQQNTAFKNPLVWVQGANTGTPKPYQLLRLEIWAETVRTLYWDGQYVPSYGFALPTRTPARDAQGKVVKLSLLWCYDPVAQTWGLLATTDPDLAKAPPR